MGAELIKTMTVVSKNVWKSSSTFQNLRFCPPKAPAGRMKDGGTNVENHEASENITHSY